MALSQHDKQNLSLQQQSQIQSYTRDYERAAAIGDEKGMQLAHAGAEAVRSQAGYSGGVDGGGYINTTAPVYSAKQGVHYDVEPQKAPINGMNTYPVYRAQQGVHYDAARQSIPVSSPVYLAQQGINYDAAPLRKPLNGDAISTAPTFQANAERQSRSLTDFGYDEDEGIFFWNGHPYSSPEALRTEIDRYVSRGYLSQNGARELKRKMSFMGF